LEEEIYKRGIRGGLFKGGDFNSPLLEGNIPLPL